MEFLSHKNSQPSNNVKDVIQTVYRCEIFIIPSIFKNIF